MDQMQRVAGAGAGAPPKLPKPDESAGAGTVPKPLNPPDGTGALLKAVKPADAGAGPGTEATNYWKPPNPLIPAEPLADEHRRSGGPMLHVDAPGPFYDFAQLLQSRPTPGCCSSNAIMSAWLLQLASLVATVVTWWPLFVNERASSFLRSR